jgi:signal transduction histidine kinase
MQLQKHPILIIDDEIHNLETLERTFRGIYQIHAAPSAHRALEIMDKHEIHLILADQRMPEMTGIEMLVKAKEKQPDAIRIILTAYTDVEDLIDAINKGQVYRYITKPWEPEDLKLTVRRALDHYEEMIKNKLLMEELKQKNVQLEKQNRELLKLDDMKNKFMMVSAHELRTPLSVVSTALELLQYQATDFNQQQRELLDNAREAIDRLTEVVNDILDIITIDSNQLDLRLETISFSKVLELALVEYTEAIENRKIKFERDVDENVVLTVDRKRIVQVLKNLISNAIKFTPDGKRVVISAKNEDGICHIIVEDEGIGIDKDELEGIFDKFHSLGNPLHHSTSKVKFMGGGTGLGLAICRGLVKFHNGKIWAESEGKNKGSKFHILLPLAQQS